MSASNNQKNLVNILRICILIFACTAIAFGIMAYSAVHTKEYLDAASSYYWKAQSYNLWADTYNQVLSLDRMASSMGLDSGLSYKDIQEPMIEMTKLENEMKPLEEIITPALEKKEHYQSIAVILGSVAGLLIIVLIALTVIRKRKEIGAVDQEADVLPDNEDNVIEDELPAE